MLGLRCSLIAVNASQMMSFKKLIIGSFLRIKHKCLSCEVQSTWDYQHFLTNVNEGNLLISAAILFITQQCLLSINTHIKFGI